jgi:hypothetical protein
MENPQLSLTPETQTPEKSPVMGWFGVIFGFLGIFTVGFIFAPLGLICSVIALFIGQASWGFIGLLLNIAGVLTSSVLMPLIGLATFAFWFDLNDYILPILQLIGLGGTEV